MNPTTSGRNIEVVKSPFTLLLWSWSCKSMFTYVRLLRKILRSEVLRWAGVARCWKGNTSDAAAAPALTHIDTRDKPLHSDVTMWQCHIHTWQFPTMGIVSVLVYLEKERGMLVLYTRSHVCPTDMRKLFVSFIGLLRTLKGPLRQPYSVTLDHIVFLIVFFGVWPFPIEATYSRLRKIIMVWWPENLNDLKSKAPPIVECAQACRKNLEQMLMHFCEIVNPLQILV